MNREISRDPDGDRAARWAGAAALIVVGLCALVAATAWLFR